MNGIISLATRDRYDESYDMIRAVRDKKYKYIRNYYPDKPYLLLDSLPKSSSYNAGNVATICRR